MAKKKKKGKDRFDEDSQRCHHRRGRSCRWQGSCRCPSLGVSSMVKGIGRCLFVSCYPVIQCFGLDESRHQHHLHRHF